ncbi:MAG: peptidoglycan editing factor PgeF [Gammaproteobacteria bacterium]
MHWPTSWIVPQWPAPGHVRAVVTSREGGVSAPPFDTFNLGDHVRDDPGHVQSNRAALARFMAARPVFLQQVHGTQVLVLENRVADGEQADACLTTEAGLACTVMVADCLPVLLTDPQGQVVAAAHAGWRGLAGVGGAGVLETAAQAMREVLAREKASDLMAWLGPCIGPDHFEVGDEVRQAFADAGLDVASTFRRGDRPGKWMADLAGLARQSLGRAGVTAVYGNDGSPPWCTVHQASRFFSHRRDAGRFGSTGRMAACIWRVG